MTDTLLERVQQFAAAYPESMFPEITEEERTWLIKTRPGLLDRISASMGRHMAKALLESLDCDARET